VTEDLSVITAVFRAPLQQNSTNAMTAALEHSERELSRAQSGEENSRMPLAD
jgi:hypothetical protein